MICEAKIKSGNYGCQASFPLPCSERGLIFHSLRFACSLLGLLLGQAEMDTLKFSITVPAVMRLQRAGKMTADLSALGSNSPLDHCPPWALTGMSPAWLQGRRCLLLAPAEQVIMAAGSFQAGSEKPLSLPVQFATNKAKIGQIHIVKS